MSTYMSIGMSVGAWTTVVGERSLTWSAVIALLLTLPVGSVRAQNPEAEKASVVRIESKAPEGPQRIGTGFVVRVDADLVYIATASHVVEGDSAPQIEFFARRDRKVTAGIVRLEGGDPKGIALLVVRGADNIPVGLRPLTFASPANVQSGQDVAVIGFGLGQGDWAIIRASIASVEGRDLRLDGRIEEGNSGGPVLRDTRVVGLVTSVSQGFGVAMPSLFVAAILQGWGIDVLAAPGIDTVGRTGGQPATPAPAAPAPTTPADPIVVRFISQMDDPNVPVRRNALRVLADRAPASATAMSAVIAAALNGDWRVRTDAVQFIGQLRPQSKDAVTNLIIGLDDADENVRRASTAALTAYPQDNEAVAALLKKLGTPTSVNTRAMNSLVRMGVNDPSLTEALLHEATLANDAAITALLTRAPFSGDMISRMTLALAAALDSRFTDRQQALLGLMLKGGGVPARDSLRGYLSTADDFHKSRLVLSWLELDRKAGAEMLQVVPRTALIAEFTKALDRNEREEIFLPETRDFSYLGDRSCAFGVMLRGAMGVLVLDLPPSEDAFKVMAVALRGSGGNVCSDYAAITMRSFKPTFQKRLIPILASSYPCVSGAPRVSQDVAADTLAELGDEQTIALLEDLDAKRHTSCGEDDPLGPKNLGRLVARIRARTARR